MTDITLIPFHMKRRILHPNIPNSTCPPAGEAYELFATMLTQRPWEELTDTRAGLGQRLALEYTEEERRVGSRS